MRSPNLEAHDAAAGQFQFQSPVLEKSLLWSYLGKRHLGEPTSEFTRFSRIKSVCFIACRCSHLARKRSKKWVGRGQDHGRERERERDLDRSACSFATLTFLLLGFWHFEDIGREMPFVPGHDTLRMMMTLKWSLTSDVKWSQGGGGRAQITVLSRGARRVRVSSIGIPMIQCSLSRTRSLSFISRRVQIGDE